VAVVADLDTGRVQIGSGYLVSRRQALTARHCTVDKKTGRPARSLRVVRRFDGAQAPAVPSCLAADVALITVAEDPAWPVLDELEPPRFGRVDRSHSGELIGCEAVGFPLWQLDPRDQQRNAAELHGTIRLTEEAESGLLVLRDPLLADVTVPASVTVGDQAEGSPWGGLSGALVFYRGTALGVVIEHHPRKGRSAITILPVVGFGAVAKALGLPPPAALPAAGEPELEGLIDVLVHGRLPRVATLDPYTLGATPSAYGNADTYGQRDQYVSRAKENLITAALCPGRLVVLVGPSKAGKTRTAFEALLRHANWHDALLAAPVPQTLTELAGHSALRGHDQLVIWLDDLQRFLPPIGELSRATISRFLDRPGPVVLLATLRAEQRELLRGAAGEITRDVRAVLDLATSIDLGSTREDPDEQAQAAAAYPQLSSRQEGLAETLAGAPELLRRYRDAAAADPLLHSLVQTCVDWARCGLTRPIEEPDLLAVALNALSGHRPDLDPSDEELHDALRRARQPIAGGGQVALLHTWKKSHAQTRGYEAFDYLVAYDDGQGGQRIRPVPEATWHWFLDRATDDDAFRIGYAAAERDNMPVAMVASRRAAEAGHTLAQAHLGTLLFSARDLAGARIWLTRAAKAGSTGAQGLLGMLLYNAKDLAEARIWLTRAAEAEVPGTQPVLGRLLLNLDPPEVAEARTWLTRAAEAGDTDAQCDLGRLLTFYLDPPELAEGRSWFTRAAEAGNTKAQFGLGALLAMLDPPEVAEARTWLTRAAKAGHTDAQSYLGRLLTFYLDPPELAEARSWFTRAAKAGNTDAQHRLGQLLSVKLDPPELAEARTWLTRAAKAGHTDAQHDLGALLWVGLDRPELEEARTWLTRAAKAGHSDAQYHLGRLLVELDPPELAEARSWFTRAAKAGHSDAQYHLGRLLATMLDPPELAEARGWLTRAAEAGHTGAQYSLAMVLTKLSPPEMAEARAWLTRAAEAGHVSARRELPRLDRWLVLLSAKLDSYGLAEVRTWLTRASEAGHVSAQDVLIRASKWRSDRFGRGAKFKKGRQ
jgi:TPR repeat protein